MTQTSSPRQIFIGLFVAILLSIAGLIAFVCFCIQLGQWRATHDLVETPATINQVVLDPSGPAHIRFSYTFHNRLYQGRADIGTASSSTEPTAEQQALFTKLRQLQQSSEPYPVYVHPAHPDNPMLQQELRLTLNYLLAVAAFLLGGIGFGLIAFLIASQKYCKAADDLISKYPAEPWRHKPEWETSSIQSRPPIHINGLLAATAYVDVISVPVLFHVFFDLLSGSTAGLFLLMFPVLSILFTCFALRVHLQWREFGGAVFLMDPCPVTGTEVTGTIRAVVPLPPGSVVQILLRCNRIDESQGRHGSTLWNDELTFEVPDEPTQEVPVSFALPDSAPRTSMDYPKISWELHAGAAIPGIDFSVVFELPIFNEQTEVVPESETDPVPALAGADSEQEVKV